MDTPKIGVGSREPEIFNYLYRTSHKTRANLIIFLAFLLWNVSFLDTILTSEQISSPFLWNTLNLTSKVENAFIDHDSKSVILAGSNYINKYDLDLKYLTGIKVTDGCIDLNRQTKGSITNKFILTTDNVKDGKLLISCWHNDYSDTINCCSNEISKFEKINSLRWQDSPELKLKSDTLLKTSITDYNGIIVLSYHDQNVNQSDPYVFPKIGIFNLARDSLEITSSLQYNPNLANNRIFDEYIYMFKHDAYNYIILNTVKEQAAGKRTNFDARIARICKNDTDLNSYIEIKLTCDVPRYARASAAYFAGTILYVIYEKKNEFSEETNRDTSYLCSYSITKIDKRFLEANERCHIDRSDTSVQLLTKFTTEELNLPPGVCNKKSRDIEGYCNPTDNPHIDGTHIDFSSKMHRFKHASFKLSSINFLDGPYRSNELSQILYLGTNTGYLLKLHTAIDNTNEVSTKILLTVDLSSGEIKYGSDEFQYRENDQSKDYRFISDQSDIIALDNQGSVHKLPKDSCMYYTTCYSCFFYRRYDPLRCNWCGDSCSSDKCAADVPQDDTCHPKIKSFSPKNGPTTGGTRLRIDGDGFGTSSGEIVIKLNDKICHLTRKSEKYIDCITESVADQTESRINVTVLDISGAVHFKGTTITNESYIQKKVKVHGLSTENATAEDLGLIVHGENLEVGANRKVVLGNVTCDISSFQYDRLKCRLHTKSFNRQAENKSISSLALRVLIDDHEQVLESKDNLPVSLPLSAIQMETSVTATPFSMGSNQAEAKHGSSISWWLMGFILLASFTIAILFVRQGMVLKVKKMTFFQSNNGSRNPEVTNRNDNNVSQHIEMSEPLSGNGMTSQAISDAEYPLVMNDNSLRDRLIQEGIWIERNRFHFLHQLGEGQFGKVFKGILKDYETGKEINVAIKTLHNTCSREDNEAFLEEGTMMKNFKHENVLTLIGITLDSHRGSPMIITPFMLYGDLRTYVKEEEPSIRQLLDFGLQVARGMAYLAEHNFLHRDLAARNCMLDENLTVKVADFGLARPLFYSDYYRSYNPGLLPIKWMAPESISESRYTEKSDVWSYGVLLWELMARGLKPYPDLQPSQLQFYLGSGNRMLRPSLCPVPLYKVMLQCWDIEPNARPTFKELVEKVSNVINQSK